VVRVNTFEGFQRPPTQGNIDVFTSTSNIPYLYKEIGLITVDDEGWGRSESELLEIVVQRARQLGANGVIILGQDKQLDGYVPVGNIPVAVNRRIVRATAIVNTGKKESPNLIAPVVDKSNISVADELRKLKQLLDDGVITEEEFEKQKRKLLDE